MGAMKEISAEIEERGINTDDCDIVVTRSTVDGALLIIVDTRPEVRRVRIDLNDGTIWDQDPEEDVPAMLDKFDVVKPYDEPEPVLVCKTCQEGLGLGKIRVSLREFVADAKLHRCETEEEAS